MSTSRRKLMLVATAAAALVGAGAAGAVIRANIVSITSGNYGDLVGTHITCKNLEDLESGLRSFLCFRYVPSGATATGTYAIEMNTRGIVVQRWTGHLKVNHGIAVVHKFCYRAVSRSPLAC
jgi:hypothetical protein